MLEVAAGGEVEMLAKRVGESRLAPDIADDPVAAPQRERNGFAEVPQDDLEPWIGVEQPAYDEPDGRNGRFRGKSPCHRQEREIASTIF